MSLNCLSCGQALPRTDSDRENDRVPEKGSRKARVQVDRIWSGIISPPPCQPTRGGAVAKIKAAHRRVHSAGYVGYPRSPGPRLVRSSGMRRDWSFENLAENQDTIVICH